MGIEREIFGIFKDPDSGEEVEVLRYTLSSAKGVVVKVISYGATMSSVEVPDKNGKTDHVILGFDSLEGYTKFNYIGSTIGRYANRIKEGKFHLSGRDHQLTINNNNNHLHGGKRGWNAHVWKSWVEGSKVTFTHHSPHGDEGYPGEVVVQTTYCLDKDGSLKVDYQAMSSTTTPVNVTNHAFFNLAGHWSGQKGLFEHDIEVFADCYLPLSAHLIPTGVLEPVTNSGYDLRKRSNIAVKMSDVPDKGFDHCFCITQKKRGTLEMAAIFTHEESGRQLQVWTTEPAVQLYTGNFLPTEEGVMVGREGVSYTHQGAFCCEPENFPDAVNQENFPSAILLPGKVYKHSLIYKFTTLA